MKVNVIILCRKCVATNTTTQTAMPSHVMLAFRWRDRTLEVFFHTSC